MTMDNRVHIADGDIEVITLALTHLIQHHKEGIELYSKLDRPLKAEEMERVAARERVLAAAQRIRAEFFRVSADRSGHKKAARPDAAGTDSTNQ